MECIHWRVFKFFPIFNEELVVNDFRDRRVIAFPFTVGFKPLVVTCIVKSPLKSNNTVGNF